MRDMERRFAQFLAVHGRPLAVLCLLSVVLPLYCLKDARIDNSTEVWLGKDSDPYRQYQRFLDKYGNEEFVVIAGEAEDPLSEASLAFQKELADRLDAIEQVDRVFDLATVRELLSPFRKDWRELMRDSELFRNLLIGRNGQTFGLVVYLETLNDPTLRSAAVEQMRSVVAEVAGDSMRVHLAGTALMNLELDMGSRTASRRFLPVAAVLSVVLLAIILRSFGAMAAVMCSLGVTTIWTMGLLVASGRSVNMITVAIPSLLFVLAISGGIHITSRFLAFLPDAPDPPAAVVDALAEVMRPVFLSNVTTAVGFGALAVSDMEPVVEFGMFTALGILLSFVFNIGIIPGVLCTLVRSRPAVRLVRPHWTAAVGRVMVRHRHSVLAISIVVFGLCIGLTTRSTVESNVLRFFPSDSKVRRDYQFIGDRLTGFYTMELDATISAARGSTLLKGLEAVGEKVAGRPEVAKVIHYKALATCFRDIPRPVLVPSQTIARNPLRPMLRTYRHKEGDRLSLRLSVLVRAMSSNDFYDLLAFIERQADDLLPADSSYYVTGVASLTRRAEQSLIETQIRSLSIASSLILLLVGLFLRSLKGLVVAVLPNLLPIFFVFAVMSLLGVPFDTATVMIASIAIGIAADDTIHFLAHFKTEKRSGLTTIDAVDQSLQKAGRAITYTSVVASAGFVILLLAEFQPIQYFGVFTGLTMLAAWAGDVFVLPACVAHLRLWESPDTNSGAAEVPGKRSPD